jgi:hypothetical protein
MAGFKPTGSGPLGSGPIVYIGLSYSSSIAVATSSFTGNFHEDYGPVASLPVASIPGDLSGGIPNFSRYIQDPATITFSGYAPASVTTQSPQIIATWVGVEASTIGASAARLSSYVVEALGNGSSISRVSSYDIEVLRTTSDLPTEAHISFVGLEVLLNIPGTGFIPRIRIF